MPDWVKRTIDEWTVSSGLTSGPLFRAVNAAGRTWGNGFTPKVIWSIFREGAANCGLSGLAPHDLRRTYARLCHQAGGEPERIQFLLGHVSIETTERYLGGKQRFQNAPRAWLYREMKGESSHESRTLERRKNLMPCCSLLCNCQPTDGRNSCGKPARAM
jgi:integrase